MPVEMTWLKLAVVSIVLLIFALTFAHAHDAMNPDQDEWYEALKQPDNPSASCCGIADGYWCDDLHTRDGKNYCTISDDRVIPKRTPRPVGMEIEIPDNKMLDGHKTRGNPTGHSVVFLTSGFIPAVYCFVMGTAG